MILSCLFSPQAFKAGSPPPETPEPWWRGAVLSSEDILAPPYGIIAASEAFTQSTPQPSLPTTRLPPHPSVSALGSTVAPQQVAKCLGSHFGTAVGAASQVSLVPRAHPEMWRESDILQDLSQLWAGSLSGSTCRLHNLHYAHADLLFTCSYGSMQSHAGLYMLVIAFSYRIYTMYMQAYVSVCMHFCSNTTDKVLKVCQTLSLYLWMGSGPET
jgi:hypothetical protein